MSRYRLFISCDEPPIRPFNGNNRRMYELAQALQPEWDIHFLVYLSGDSARKSFLRAWADKDVSIHFFNRNPRLRYLRSVIRGEQLPTVDRNFAAEAALIKALTVDPERTKLLLDNVLVSPLVKYFLSGVVISGPDCMSRIFAEAARCSDSLITRFHNSIRSMFARNSERRWYHKADIVHVVSWMDRHALLRVNPKANIHVIPLGVDAPLEVSLQPWAQRSHGVIWANLDFPPACAGVKHILQLVNIHCPGLFSNWTLLGGVPLDQAMTTLPTLATSGINYLQWTDNLSNLLESHQFVLCPDAGGGGQKNRCLDALAHGCLLVGTEEVLRDLRGHPGEHYCLISDLTSLQSVLSMADTNLGEQIAQVGQSLYRTHFSHPALAHHWSSLLKSAGPLIQHYREGLT
jgi:hypothetical protein